MSQKQQGHWQNPTPIGNFQSPAPIFYFTGNRNVIHVHNHHPGPGANTRTVGAPGLDAIIPANMRFANPPLTFKNEVNSLPPSSPVANNGPPSPMVGARTILQQRYYQRSDKCPDSTVADKK